MMNGLKVKFRQYYTLQTQHYYTKNIMLQYITEHINHVTVLNIL